jgi:hypothetical protein
MQWQRMQKAKQNIPNKRYRAPVQVLKPGSSEDRIDRETTQQHERQRCGGNINKSKSETPMSGYDPVIERLRKLGHWTEDTPDEQIWSDVKVDLQRQPPHERARGIKNLDAILGEAEIPLTRDSARTFMHLREARDIHETLLKSGR